MGGQKGLLDRVLGFFERPEQMPAEREQRASMAIEQNLEGDLVALAELLDEPLVARPGEEGPEPKDGEGGGGQVVARSGTSFERGRTVAVIDGPTRLFGSLWWLSSLSRTRETAAGWGWTGPTASSSPTAAASSSQPCCSGSPS